MQDKSTDREKLCNLLYCICFNVPNITFECTRVGGNWAVTVYIYGSNDYRFICIPFAQMPPEIKQVVQCIVSKRCPSLAEDPVTGKITFSNYKENYIVANLADRYKHGTLDCFYIAVYEEGINILEKGLLMSYIKQLILDTISTIRRITTLNALPCNESILKVAELQLSNAIESEFD